MEGWRCQRQCTAVAANGQAGQQSLKQKIWGEGTPFSVWAHKFHLPQPWGQGPSDAYTSEYSMPNLPFFFSNCICVLLMPWSARCSVLSYNDLITMLRACNKQLLSVILHRMMLSLFWSYTTVPVAVRLPFLCIFTDLWGAGTLVANNQRCRNAIPLHPKALSLLCAQIGYLVR